MTEPRIRLEDLRGWVERIERSLDLALSNDQRLDLAIILGDVTTLEMAKVTEKIRAALQALVDRLDAIADHPEFGRVFTMAVVHGYEYRGPNWGQPLAEAKKVLAEEAGDGGQAVAGPEG